MFYLLKAKSLLSFTVIDTYPSRLIRVAEVTLDFESVMILPQSLVEPLVD